jgi:hypothetical protein
MILTASFSSDWIYSHRSKKGFEKINPPLAEKMIHALALVESLAVSGLDFVFKGGTSLILLMPDAGRFSIDIDIITTVSRPRIEDVLKKICDGKPFISFTLNEQRSYKPGIPKAHYSMLYTSGLTSKQDHILLDILFDEHPYPYLLEKPVVTEWLQTDERVIPVKMPTHESITGDKLTAFAPNTTGIPYKRGKELEIIKQLHDLGRLYHEIKDISIVKSAFDNTVEKEIIYRGNTCTREDVIQDIIQTGLLIARREKNKEQVEVSNFKEIQTGLLQFKAYQMSSFFRIDEAIVSAAKAALMAAKVKIAATGKVELFNAENKKQDYLIPNPDFNFLNKLPAEALFYWNKALRTLGVHE